MKAISYVMLSESFLGFAHLSFWQAQRVDDNECGIDRGKPNCKNLSQCRFFHHKSQRVGQGSNPSLRAEWLMTDRLSHGTASLYTKINLNYSSKTSLYRAVSTLHLGFNKPIT
jgi:hypothetical protein